MTLTVPIATHLREGHFGGNRTSVHLTELSWQQATTQVHTLRRKIGQLLLTNLQGLIKHSHYHLLMQLVCWEVVAGA
jgi:hypothetical protein